MSIDELTRRRDYLRHQANNMAVSWHNIKSNPMDLNLLMEHLGVLSSIVDSIMTNIANDIDVSLNKEMDMVMHCSDDTNNHQDTQ
jgi:hypothetical protein